MSWWPRRRPDDLLRVVQRLESRVSGMEHRILSLTRRSGTMNDNLDALRAGEQNLQGVDHAELAADVAALRADVQAVAAIGQPAPPAPQPAPTPPPPAPAQTTTTATAVQGQTPTVTARPAVPTPALDTTTGLPAAQPTPAQPAADQGAGPVGQAGT